MVQVVEDVVNWLRQWFYDEGEIDTKVSALQGQINNKASQADLNTLTSAVNGKLDASDYVVDSSLNGNSSNPVQNALITNALNLKADRNHGHGTDVISEASALSHLNTAANASQHTINVAIDSAISNLTNIELTEIVDDLPTASANTMNKLYLLVKSGGSSGDSFDIYITVNPSDSTYEWEKVDDFDLQDLSISWASVTNKPSSFPPASHTHGNLNNDGSMSNISTGYVTINNIVGIDGLSNKIRAFSHVPATFLYADAAYTNLGTTQYATQKQINAAVNTAVGSINTSISSKEDAGNCITSIELIDKTDQTVPNADTGVIKLYYGDE